MFEPFEQRRPTRAPNDDRRGRPLESSTRARFTGALGTPLPDVRIRDDAHADAEARRVGAAAWTRGDEIGFRRGHYRPGTIGGDILLAHELAHAVQQRGAEQIDQSPGTRLEHDADTVAAHAAAHLAGFESTSRAPSLRSGLRLSRCPPAEKNEGSETPTDEVAERIADGDPAPSPGAPKKKPETPAERQRRVFGKRGDTFIESARKWTDSRKKANKKNIEERRALYEDKGWQKVEEDDRIRRYTERITELEGYRKDLDAELAKVSKGGSDVLNLANVIYNEAGSSSDAAKRGIAYAWMNRAGGVMREPTGQEISGYTPLTTRWANLSDTQKLTFIEQFIPSVRIARERLVDKNPATNDPTRGATHWVSPSGLSKFDAKRHSADRYSRTVGAHADRAFPKWARDENSPEAKKLIKAGQAGADYEELTIPGVPETEFLFYRDVR